MLRVLRVLSRIYEYGRIASWCQKSLDGNGCSDIHTLVSDRKRSRNKTVYVRIRSISRRPETCPVTFAILASRSLVNCIAHFNRAMELECAMNLFGSQLMILRHDRSEQAEQSRGVRGDLLTAVESREHSKHRGHAHSTGMNRKSDVRFLS